MSISNFGFTPLQSIDRTDLNQTTATPAENRLKAFVENHCEGISVADATRMIHEGKKIADTMCAQSTTPQEWQTFLNSPSCDKKAAVCLTWFLTWKTACNEELFTSGATRIAPGEKIDGEKLRQFFRACGGKKSTSQTVKNPETGTEETKIIHAEGMAYSRISTHMGKDLKLRKGDTQFGLDIKPFQDGGKKYALPAGKKTILFDALTDKSFYMKLEEHGVPPFWKEGFRSPENVKEFLGHTVSYIQTRKPIKKVVNFVRQIRLKSTGSVQEAQSKPLETRKEHIPDKVMSAFKKAVKDIYHTKEERERLIQQAKQGGISAMHRIVSESTGLEKIPDKKNMREPSVLEKALGLTKEDVNPKLSGMKDSALGVEQKNQVHSLEMELNRRISYAQTVGYHTDGVEKNPNIQGDEVLLASVDKLVEKNPEGLDRMPSQS